MKPYNQLTLLAVCLLALLFSVSAQATTSSSSLLSDTEMAAIDGKGKPLFATNQPSTKLYQWEGPHFHTAVVGPGWWYFHDVAAGARVQMLCQSGPHQNQAFFIMPNYDLYLNCRF